MPTIEENKLRLIVRMRSLSGIARKSDDGRVFGGFKCIMYILFAHLLLQIKSM
jgi:hypothetical protein